MLADIGAPVGAPLKADHLVIPAVLAALSLAPALARDNGQYENVDPVIRARYRNAELTEAAQKHFPFKKCCEHSDVFRTKIQVNKTTGGDEWFYLVEGQWKRSPPDIVHEGEHAPGGQPTLFIYEGKETCFFPGESGI